MTLSRVLQQRSDDHIVPRRLDVLKAGIQKLAELVGRQLRDELQQPLAHALGEARAVFVLWHAERAQHAGGCLETLPLRAGVIGWRGVLLLRGLRRLRCRNRLLHDYLR